MVLCPDVAYAQPAALPEPGAEPPAQAVAPQAPAPAPDAAAKAIEDAATRLEAAASALREAGEQLKEASQPKEEDPENELLVVRTQWNGFFLRFAEKEKTATTSFSLPISDGDFLLSGGLTVPLDEETRRAPLLDQDGAAPAFQARLAFEFNSAIVDLKAQLDGRHRWAQQKCAEYQRETKTQIACPPADKSHPFYKWLHRQLGPAGGAMERATPPALVWTLGAEAEFAFDRQEVYDGDLAADPEDRSATDFSVGAVARFYPTRWLAIPVRAGGGFSDGIRTKEVNRCEVATSSTAEISGNSCESVQLLTADPALSGDAYVDAALVFAVPVPVLAELQPGFELRSRADGLGALEILHTSVTAFVSPTSVPVLTRFGVGLELNLAMDDDEGSSSSFVSGDTWFTPFLLVGAGI